jgi:hypothetical protein
VFEEARRFGPFAHVALCLAAPAGEGRHSTHWENLTSTRLPPSIILRRLHRGALPVRP